MANNTTSHTLPAWTEVEYTALCKNPYLSTPFFVPKEAKFFLCREDGSREEMRMIFMVFKAVGSAEDSEWEDDPVPGEVWAKPLGDDDEEIEPVKLVYLGMDIDRFISVVEEDENRIVFDIFWRYGDVKLEKAKRTGDGFVCNKEDFGDEGLTLTLTPKEGEPFSMQLQMPYFGFSLYAPDGSKLHDDVEIPQDQVADYRYDFVGDAMNDRFTLNLDNDHFIYQCVFRPEDGTMAVRDTREKLAVVAEIPSEGKLPQLLMGAHHALVKNKNFRWRIALGGSSVVQHEELVVEPEALVKFAKEQFDNSSDKDTLGAHLVSLEPKYAFQWCWLKDEDWQHDGSEFDMFMRMLVAFSYVNQKPNQGDQLQARNNKRKIRRCAKMVKEHLAGELNLWEQDEETRKEVLHLFGTFHREFTAELESEE